jgi:hypothetical protein
MGRRGSPGRGGPELWDVEALQAVEDNSYETPWRTVVMGRRGSPGRGL